MLSPKTYLTKIRVSKQNKAKNAKMQVFFKISQFFGFILTEILNILLLYLIFTKASTRFGSYKYLMISYAVYSLIYALVEILTQPIIHVHDASVFLYVDSFLKHETTISNQLAAIYCASFSLCISLLATHFAFRYFAVCRWDFSKLTSNYILQTAKSTK